jgi:hypothetical protein
MPYPTDNRRTVELAGAALELIARRDPRALTRAAEALEAVLADAAVEADAAERVG